MAWRNPLLDSNPFLPIADDTPALADLPAWQRDEALEGLTRGTRPTSSKLLGLLNVPNSLKNDILMGRPLFSGTETGETLDAYGLRPSEDTWGGWGRPIAEFAFDAGTDPLNLVSFGAGAASKATLAARAAGIADDVTRVAGRNLVDDVARGARDIDRLGDMGYARNATRSLHDNFGKGIADLTDDDLLSRPIVGSRTAGRNTTLRELVEAQANPGAAREGIEQWLQKNHRMGYADVANDRLYNDVGLWLPKVLGGPVGAQIPDAFGGRALGAGSAALFDRAGQALRWSKLGRGAVSASNIFGDNVQGATEEGQQILSKSLVRSDRAATEAASRWTTRMARELAERSPAAFGDPQVSTAVRNVIEGTASAADQALVTSNNLDSFVTQWRTTADDYITRSREAGIGSGELNDPYGTKYFPRGVDDGVFGRNAPDMGGKSGKDWSVMTGDQLARDAAYQVPGGTNTINELSRDAAVTGAANDAIAADHILQTVNSRVGAGPAYTRAQAVKLARDIRSMSPEARASGRGLFDRHFLEDASRYVRGRERAIGRSRVLYDALGSSANVENYLQVPGGRHDSMLRTLTDLDLRTTNTNGVMQGAQQQILDRINARLAGTGQTLTAADLANVSIDQRIVDRFNRISDYYAMPEVQGVLGKFMDDLTNMWKSSILTWPARFARDWFSGAISNTIEVGNVNDLRNGYAAAKYLLQGQTDRLGPLVAQMPRYQTLAETNMDAAIAAFRDDLGASGILGGRRIEDVGARWTGSQTGESIRDAVLPGASPVTTVGYQVGDALSGRTPLSPNNAAYSEFYNGGIRSYTDPLRRFAGAINPFGGENFSDYIADRQLTDPSLRWGAKLGDTTDTINRVGGYAGLMFQGVSVPEASRRIMAAQVDYSSLTRFEKGFIKSFVPFWSYNSRIGAYVAQKIWNRPGGAYTNVALRAPDAVVNQTDADNPDDSYTPKQIKESVGFSLEGLRGVPGLGSVIDALAPETPGVNSFLNSIDVPGRSLINMLNVKQGLDGSVKYGDSAYNTFLDTTSQLMHPIIRDGVELLSGRNLHTGKSLNEFEPTIQKLGRAAGVDPYSTPDYLLKGSNMLLDFVPHAPRVLQLTNRLMDDERVPNLSARLGQNAFNMLTGSKITNISEDAARMDASRELTDMLSDSPAIKKFESKYIPEEMLPYASPDDVLLYRLDRQMRKEARAAKKAQAKNFGELGNPFQL
jgi:hypothetical protein